MYKIIVTIFSAVLLFSCAQQEKSSPNLSKAITQENLLEVKTLVANDNLMTKEEIDLFNSGLSRIALNENKDIYGMTFGEIIDSQRVFIKERSLSVLDDAVNKVAIIKNHKFSYIGLKPQDEEARSLDILVFEITNTSNQEIKNMKGLLQFLDQQGNTVKKYPIEISKVIGDRELTANETLKFAYPFEHESENQRDQIIRNNHNQLRPIWLPSEMVLANGTTIAIKN